MKENKITVVIVCIAFVLMLAYVFTFQVDTTEMAIHYRPPGTVHREINVPDAEEDESGLYFRLPFPVDQVRKFDRKVRVLDGPLSETPLQDDWQVLLSVFASWRITDPVLFVENLGGDADVATRRLREIISSEASNALSDMTFANLVSTNAEDVKLQELEATIGERTGRVVRDNDFGLEVLSFGVRRIAIPDATTEAVFNRMRAERESVAQAYESEGDKRYEEITSAARSEAEEIRAEAEAEARRIETEGEAAEAEFYKVFAEAPELAIYLRRLESLRNIAERARQEGTPISFVLDTRSEPLSVLYSGPQADSMPPDPIHRAITDAELLVSDDAAEEEDDDSEDESGMEDEPHDQ